MAFLPSLFDICLSLVVKHKIKGSVPVEILEEIQKKQKCPAYVSRPLDKSPQNLKRWKTIRQRWEDHLSELFETWWCERDIKKFRKCIYDRTHYHQLCFLYGCYRLHFYKIRYFSFFEEDRVFPATKNFYLEIENIKERIDLLKLYFYFWKWKGYETWYDKTLQLLVFHLELLENLRRKNGILTIDV
jgi:hypothetical protein